MSYQPSNQTVPVDDEDDGELIPPPDALFSSASSPHDPPHNSRGAEPTTVKSTCSWDPTPGSGTTLTSAAGMSVHAQSFTPQSFRPTPNTPSHVRGPSTAFPPAPSFSAGGGSSSELPPQTETDYASVFGSQEQLPPRESDDQPSIPEQSIEVYTPGFKSIVTVPMRQVFHTPPPHLRVTRLVLCANFHSDDPTSCQMGNRCKFVHAEVQEQAMAAQQEVHVNYAWRTLESVGYPRFPAGTSFLVAPPNSSVANVSVPSDWVLRTNAVNASRRPLSHCAHYYYNRACNRGPKCNFIHAIYVDPDARDHQRAPVPSQQFLSRGSYNATLLPGASPDSTEPSQNSVRNLGTTRRVPPNLQTQVLPHHATLPPGLAQQQEEERKQQHQRQQGHHQQQQQQQFTPASDHFIVSSSQDDLPPPFFGPNGHQAHAQGSGSAATLHLGSDDSLPSATPGSMPKHGQHFSPYPFGSNADAQ